MRIKVILQKKTSKPNRSVYLGLGVFLFVFLISTNKTFSQLSKVDSLQIVLKQKDLEAGEKVISIGRLAAHYYFDDNKSEGIEF